MTSYQPELQNDTEARGKTGKPPLYRVLLHNDDYTTMEFVIDILRKVFNKSPEAAETIMLNVHRQGMGVCGVFPYEIAETKVDQVHNLARQNEFPLRCSMEQE
ncbi:ATP-dependent Clp protease adapter ClpS [Desulfosarcina sp. OttesenSCG-928-A07]|nr:ATP-dependent Clp protease adapter ClpS [Desulfosarcina sp. OttesenSCG-928-A07]